MTDFKELREALEAGPTDGPWTHAWGGGHVLIFQSGGGPTFASVHFDGMRDAEHAGANARYIAAANPSAIRSLLAELDEARRDAELERAWHDRVLKSAQDIFGEDAIRYKMSLFGNGRARNYFPEELDGKWVALQRAENDGHMGLVAMLEAQRAENAELRAAIDAMKEQQP